MSFDLFKGKNVLITGGLGFIGSSLAIRLDSLGANVLIVDSLSPEYGGNMFNISGVSSRCSVNICDIREQDTMNSLVQGQDYIFLAAAQVSHVKSLKDPFPDIDINIKGTAVIMEAVRQHNPEAVVVKLGSRGQYGAIDKLPVSEDMKSEPKGIYEISLLAAEHIILSYYRNHGIKSVLLRLTNIYGPRAQMKTNSYCVANWFIRLAIDNQTIPVFGDGMIKRDFIHIDDCIDAVLLSSLSDKAAGEVLNVGNDEPATFLEFVKILVEKLGRGKWEYAEFSKERKAQEPGDFYSDISKIKKLAGWEPKVSLEEGIKNTLEYYDKFKEEYW